VVSVLFYSELLAISYHLVIVEDGSLLSKENIILHTNLYPKPVSVLFYSELFAVRYHLVVVEAGFPLS
jgi:hypothetical protein